MSISASSSQHCYIRFTGGIYRRFRESVKATSSHAPAPNGASAGTHGSYGPLLLDPRWKSRRQQILSRDQYRCVICRSSDKLQVHHRQYHFQQSVQQFNPPWDYEDDLMITLCEKCHKKGHQQFDVPTITI